MHKSWHFPLEKCWRRLTSIQGHSIESSKPCLIIKNKYVSTVTYFSQSDPFIQLKNLDGLSPIHLQIINHRACKASVSVTVTLVTILVFSKLLKLSLLAFLCNQMNLNTNLDLSRTYWIVVTNSSSHLSNIKCQ